MKKYPYLVARFLLSRRETVAYKRDEKEGESMASLWQAVEKQLMSAWKA